MSYAYTTVYEKIALSYTTTNSQPTNLPKDLPYIPADSLYYSGSGWWPWPGFDFYSPTVFAFVQNDASSYTFYVFSTSIAETTHDSSQVNVAPTTVVYDGFSYGRGDVQIAYKPYVWEYKSVSLYVSPDPLIAPAVALGGQRQNGTVQYYDSDATATPTASLGDTYNLIVTDASGNPVTLSSSQALTLESALFTAFTEAAEAGNTNSGTIDWTFDPADPTLVPLVPAGDTVSLTIPVDVTDSQNDLVGSSDITITVQGLQGQLFTSGADTVDFNNLTPSQIAAINAGAEIYNSLDGNDTVTLPNQANYQLTSTVAWDPARTFTTGDGNDTITGGDGNYNIAIGNGTDSVAVNGDGSSAVTAGSGDDTIAITGNGNNSVTGGSGSDSVTFSGTGEDNFTGAGGNYEITLGDGSDTVAISGDGTSTIIAGSGSDTIAITGNGDNSVTGGSGSDTVSFSGTGDNTFTGAGGNYDVTLGDGSDTVTINGDGASTIAAGSGGDTITINGHGDNTIIAGGGGDTITITGNGANTIIAGSGANSITINGDGANLVEIGDGPDNVDVTEAGNTTLQNGTATTGVTITGFEGDATDDYNTGASSASGAMAASISTTATTEVAPNDTIELVTASSGTATINGAGTLVLDAKLDGEIVFNSFASNAGATLRVNATAVPSTGLAETIRGFSEADTIDFASQKGLTLATFPKSGLVDIDNKALPAAEFQMSGAIPLTSLEPVTDEAGGTKIVVDKSNAALIDPSGKVDPSEENSIIWSFIHNRESPGGVEVLAPYVSAVGSSSSGVTVGLGVDLGTNPITLEIFAEIFRAHGIK